jgi:FkbM family methyltransferase
VTRTAATDPPFGTFAPRGFNRLLIEASRHTFLGHGEPRKLIWAAVRSGRQECFDMDVDGVRMRLHPLDSSLERGLLLRPQKVYPKELGFLRQALASGGTLVDVGANVGAMSLPFARMPGVNIVAVEPGPIALGRLRFNVAANGFRNVRVDNSALSDNNGTARFFAHAGDTKLSGLGEAWAEGVEVEVRTKTFAALLAEYQVRPPYILKIDVEGHEDRVLMPFVSSSSPALWPGHVLIETIERQGVPDCVSFMQMHGYRKVFATPQNTGLRLETAENQR